MNYRKIRPLSIEARAKSDCKRGRPVVEYFSDEIATLKLTGISLLFSVVVFVMPLVPHFLSYTKAEYYPDKGPVNCEQLDEAQLPPQTSERCTNLVTEQAEQNIERVAQELSDSMVIEIADSTYSSPDMCFVHHHGPDLYDVLNFFNPIVSFVLMFVYIIPKNFRNLLPIPLVIFSAFHSIIFACRVVYWCKLNSIVQRRRTRFR